MITVKRVSPRTGTLNSMVINATREQIADWQLGKDLIQNCLPEATPEQREFLMTGYTPEDWDVIFGVRKESQR